MSAEGGEPVQRHNIPDYYERYNDEDDLVEQAATRATERTHRFPNPYINNFGTVTIDPMRDQRWIREDGHKKYLRARAKGGVRDRKSMEWTMGNLTPHIPPALNFLPTMNHINKVDKYTPKCTTAVAAFYGPAANVIGLRDFPERVLNPGIAEDTKGDPKRWGQLPRISQRIYDGNWDYGDQRPMTVNSGWNSWDPEKEMTLYNHTVGLMRDRTYDCDGWIDSRSCR